MTDQEFQELRKIIHYKIRELDTLQRRHIVETGQPYVISGPMAEPKPICKCPQGSVCEFFKKDDERCQYGEI